MVVHRAARKQACGSSWTTSRTSAAALTTRLPWRVGQVSPEGRSLCDLREPSRHAFKELLATLRLTELRILLLRWVSP